jgi:collagen triple helix repeat protein
MPRSVPSRASLLLCAFALLAALLVPAASPFSAGAAKGGVIRACAAKKGPAKGLIRIAKRGNCKRGEVKLKWSKAGKPGAAGAAGAQGSPGAQGPTGPQGAQGATGQPGLTPDLSALEDRIDALEAQVSALTAQVAALEAAMAAVNPTLAALCGQAAALTDQSNAIGAVIAGLGVVGGVVELDIPTLPDPLDSFSCPST